MARMMKDFNIKQPIGIGVDEKTAVCIDKDGNASVYGTNSAYFMISNSLPEQCNPNKPLTWGIEKPIQIFKFDGSVSGTVAFNLNAWPEKGQGSCWIREGVLRRVSNATGGMNRND